MAGIDNNFLMPGELAEAKGKLLRGYAAIFLFVQVGLPLFYAFFGLWIPDDQLWKTLAILLWTIPAGAVFSVYLPLRLLSAEHSYPNKVVFVNALGMAMVFVPAMLYARMGLGLPIHEEVKMLFAALSMGLLQCLASYLLALEGVYQHLKHSPPRRTSLYFKNVAFILCVILIGTIIVGSVAFNAIEHPEDGLLHSSAGEGPFTGYFFKISAALALALYIGIVLSFRFTNLMTLPLKELAQSANAIADGYTRKVRAVTGDEVEDLARTFNNMTEMVCKREDELIQRGQNLALLYTLAEALNENIKTKELFDLTMGWLDTTFGFEVGALRLIDGEFLKLECSRGIGQDLMDKIEYLRIGESVAGLAALKKDTMVIEDVPTVSGAYAATAKELGLECIISIPLARGNTLIGTLSIGSRSKREVDYNSVALLNSVGSLLGVAVERSSEFDRIETEKFQWETAFRFIRDIVSIHDNHWRIMKVNPAFLEYFGCNEEDVIGKYCYEIFHNTNMPPHDCPHLETSITRNSSSATLEIPGNKVFAVSVHPVFKKHGSIEGNIHIARDVTEVLRLREKIQQADKLGALGRLAAGIAHNVNNPLTYSLNYLFLLKEEAGEAKTAELIRKIEQGITQSKHVLEGLLDFSAPADRKAESIDVGRSVSDTISFLSPAIDEKNVEISSDIPGGLIIKAPKKSFEEVILNLMTNAMDAGASKIGVKGHTNSVDVTLVVSDNGSGIDKHDIPRVFEPYFTTKPKGKGTGLGLYVSYNVIASLGGTIWCTSRKGEGTQFHIHLPKNY